MADRKTNLKYESNTWHFGDCDIEVSQSRHNRDLQRGKIGKGDWRNAWRNCGWRFPKPKEGDRYTGTGSTEGPKHDKLKTYLHQDILLLKW